MNTLDKKQLRYFLPVIHDDMRYRARSEVNGNSDFAIWSFAVIDDLRLRSCLGVEREGTGGQ